MKRHAKQLMATPHPASRLGLRSNAIKEISKADKLTTVNPIATTPLTTNHPAPNAIRESPKPTSASRFRRTSTSRPTMALALGASCGLMFSMDGTARIRSQNSTLADSVSERAHVRCLVAALEYTNLAHYPRFPRRATRESMCEIFAFFTRCFPLDR